MAVKTNIIAKYDKTEYELTKVNFKNHVNTQLRRPRVSKDISKIYLFHLFFLSRLHAQPGAGTHNPKIKSHALHHLNQPGTPKVPSNVQKSHRHINKRTQFFAAAKAMKME